MTGQLLSFTGVAKVPREEVPVAPPDEAEIRRLHYLLRMMQQNVSPVKSALQAPLLEDVRILLWALPDDTLTVEVIDEAIETAPANVVGVVYDLFAEAFRLPERLMEAVIDRGDDAVFACLEHRLMPKVDNPTDLMLRSLKSKRSTIFCRLASYHQRLGVDDVETLVEAARDCDDPALLQMTEILAGLVRLRLLGMD